MRADIVPGGVLPDYELPDQTGKHRTLSELQHGDPMIVVLSRGVGAQWPFLSDPARVVQKDLDIAEYTDATHNPMVPHTLVLEPGLVIFKIYMGYWFFGRPTVEELRLDLRAVLARCRPDCEIARPELRAAWQRGDRSQFYPYGKSWAQVFAEQR
jgi:hypothetical protein